MNYLAKLLLLAYYLAITVNNNRLIMIIKTGSA